MAPEKSKTSKLYRKGGEKVRIKEDGREGSTDYEYSRDKDHGKNRKRYSSYEGNKREAVEKEVVKKIKREKNWTEIEKEVSYFIKC